MIEEDAYALDKRVTLQTQAVTRDALNKQVHEWVNALPGGRKVWACVVDLTGRQFVAAGGTQNVVQTQIKIRHRAGVTPSMRVLCGDCTYNIEAVLERDRHWLYLMCSKGLSDG